MSVFGTRKQFKRQWKRWKRTAWTTLACALVAYMAWLGLPLSGKVEKLMTTEPLSAEALGRIVENQEVNTIEPDWLLQLNKSNKSRVVHLSKIYQCGEESETLGRLSPREIISLIQDHPQWEGRISPNGEVWLEEQNEGLSEECKRNGYIGVDKNGNLSLFKGPPKKEKVIKTFFQLDVEMMESALPAEVIKQLQQGISVQDIEEYNSVISTFSDYAVEAADDPDPLQHKH